MKPYLTRDTVRLNCIIRRDIKEAMERLQEKWQQEEGSYLNLGMIFARAARMLLQREGISVEVEPMATGRLPDKKPPKPVTRRKMAARA